MCILVSICTIAFHTLSNTARDEISKWFFDEKAKLLSALIYRCNRERPRIREFVTQSEIVKEIARKLLSGIGQNCFITGKTGSGKSHTALHMCWELSKITSTKFSLDNIVFTPQEFARVYNDVEKTPEGSWIIFDEAGIGYGSRNWYDEPNKLFSELLQIIRHRKIAVFFTAPDLNFIDSIGRKLLHWWFETEKLDKRAGVCYIKPHTVEVQQATGKVLYPFPVYNLSQYSEMRVTVLPKHIVDAYEEKAQKYKNEVASNIEVKLAIASSKTDLDPHMRQYFELRKSGLKRGETMIKLDINSTKASKFERVWKAMDIMSRPSVVNKEDNP